MNDLDLKFIPIESNNTYKLKVKWKPEESQDLNAYDQIYVTGKYNKSNYLHFEDLIETNIYELY